MQLLGADNWPVQSVGGGAFKRDHDLDRSYVHLNLEVFTMRQCVA